MNRFLKMTAASFENLPNSVAFLRLIKQYPVLLFC